MWSIREREWRRWRLRFIGLIPGSCVLWVCVKKWIQILPRCRRFDWVCLLVLMKVSVEYSLCYPRVCIRIKDWYLPVWYDQYVHQNLEYAICSSTSNNELPSSKTLSFSATRKPLSRLSSTCSAAVFFRNRLSWVSVQNVRAFSLSKLRYAQSRRKFTGGIVFRASLKTIFVTDIAKIAESESLQFPLRGSSPSSSWVSGVILALFLVGWSLKYLGLKASFLTKWEIKYIHFPSQDNTRVTISYSCIGQIGFRKVQDTAPTTG